MTIQNPKLIIFCIDGAQADLVVRYDLLRSGQLQDFPAPQRLRSTYPSSTASAHASFATGVYPNVHGVIGNRYWHNQQSDVVNLSQGSPYETLHPYEISSLQYPSFVDDCLAVGLTVNAVLFPHTFSRSKHPKNLDSIYCLYTPSESIIFDTQDDKQSYQFSMFGFDIRIIYYKSVDGSWYFLCDQPNVRLLAFTNGVDCWCYRGQQAISFKLEIQNGVLHEAVLSRSTACYVLCYGDIVLENVMKTLPHSRQIDYTANPEHQFYETPTINWVTSTALSMLHKEPDVLMVRYSQVDHAQEFLYWYLEHGTLSQQAEAETQILKAYNAVEAGIHEIMAQVNWLVPAFIFSDHGIDSVEQHIYLNNLLDLAGLANEMVFQGDSSVAYLYGKPLSEEAYITLQQLIEMHELRMRFCLPEQLEMYNLYHPEHCGNLVALCDAKVEFHYRSGAGVTQHVKSAAHGYEVDSPAMHGIWMPLTATPNVDQVTHITELANVFRHILGLPRR